MRKIKIAQIGVNSNSHSNEVFKRLIQQSDDFEIAGYVLPENERERLPKRMDLLSPYKELTLDEVLNDPEIEAVAVETDEVYLTKYALMAAKAGKHIHMEKPGGVSLSDFEELIETMRKTGKVFHTGYMYRYNPYVNEMLQKIKNGELGEIISVDAQMSCIHSRTVRQWLQDFPGGMMFFLGCHLVDLILQIKGQPKRIIPLSKCTGKYVTEPAKDFGMAVFEYENGVSTAKTSAVEIGGYARRQLVVSGTEGTIELKPFEMFTPEGIYTERTEYFEKAWDNFGKHSKTEIFNRYHGMMASFAQYVRGERENPYTLDYELELFKTILKCCEG